MGDDIIELPAVQRAGSAASVPNAPAYVAQAAHWVSPSPGGAGAVRDCSDLILAAQGKVAALFSPQAWLTAGTVQRKTKLPIPYTHGRSPRLRRCSSAAH